MLTYRYIAKIILEAETPLFVGSGETSLTSDALVMRDAYGFPMIPGTSLTGVLRHELGFGDPKKETAFWGWQDGDKGEGAKLRVSSAYLILDGKIADGSEQQREKYFEYFDNLPSRQHVRINDRGTAEDKGLFDNEVVYKGCRFVFEMEARGTEEDKALWEEVIQTLQSPLFRIGQGTRNGYGRLKVLGIKEEKLNLEEEEDFKKYLNYDNSLNVEEVPNYKTNNGEPQEKNFISYKLELTPELGFLFGEGTGDDEVDAMPVKEKVVTYENENLTFKNEQILIPGSSVKGAIRHRTCFHYNRRMKRWAEVYAAKKDLKKLITGVENKAVYDLFGAQGGWDGDKHDGCFDEYHNKKDNCGSRPPKRGHVLINDVFYPEAKADKIFNHVTIDRFTGGAKDGHLFSEKIATLPDEEQNITIEIVIEDKAFDEEIIGAFEDALHDICSGLLPLGGMTTKGHGIFTGTLYKNKEKLYEYEN
ncbi:MAG TPA: hypothetical protein ENJ45_00165 [Phaeodactylibacter sp.]|nr:hypothetical protein [Phaeodactylibacter sp.]